MPASDHNLTRQPDKSNTVAHTPGGNSFYVSPQPTALCISGVVTIHMDGRLEFEPGVTLDEASELFWKRISEAYPGLFLPRDALHTAAPDLLEALKAVLAEEMIYTGAIHETLEKSGQHQELTAKIRAAILRAQGAEQ